MSASLVIEQIGGATLLLGDCREIAPSLSGVDVVIADPPYGTGKYPLDDDQGVVALLQGWSRKAVFGYPETLCRWCRELGAPDEWVTWWPTNKQVRRIGRLTSESEAIAIWGATYEVPLRPRANDSWAQQVSVARGLSPSEAKCGDVWRDASPGMACNSHLRLHPNEKPVTLLAKLVRLCSAEAETVLDPFMGSGTTGIACVRTGRRFIGIEMDPRHFETARDRLVRELDGALELPAGGRV